jgi:SpoVK/Ycf46/Vps4 family AAA+-type ATPase
MKLLPQGARTAAALALTGPPSSGKQDSARLVAGIRGAELLLVDLAGLLRSPTCPPPRSIRLLFREANLAPAVIYLAGADRLWSEDDRAAAALRALEDEFRSWSTVVVLSGPSGWEPPPVLGGHALVHVRMEAPTALERQVEWTAGIAAAGFDPARLGPTLAELAGNFSLSLERIREAVMVARAEVEMAGLDHIEARQLFRGARAVSSRHLATISHEIVPRATWDQLVLHPDSLDQLRELCSTVRHRDQVLQEAGFARRLSGGIGVTALFAGVSGTGKTMAAEVVASELGLPLFKIDLAGIVSKWIGETEKNLDRVFDAATDSNAILFFDEADALFGKRSEVKDSHDRYANLEISYLLQKMESYRGVAILATNMRQQIDDAFLRRLTFTVIFPLPEREDRRRIWEAVWPPELRRGADVDLSRLATVKLTGGNIKNIVLAAAHLAAAEGRAVVMADVVHAIRREYQKLGKQMDAREVEAALGPGGPL